MSQTELTSEGLVCALCSEVAVMLVADRQP